ncbi:SGNH hydrolase domain-containing protein, partial [Novosphingobium rosa]|uniref:SGNH hydrolase domain-containing protein n=1 Tax=Novosphingobium rosa TaxID=76978 RepID=UPI000AA21065
KPLVSIDPSRCGNWFTAHNPACRREPGDTPQGRWERMALARLGIASVVAGLPGVSLWEPAATMCPHQACPESIDGKPIYFDSDHITAYGNDLLKPSLEAALQAKTQAAGRTARP